MANLIKRILVEASPFDAMERIVRPDGEVRYVRCVGAPLIENQRLKKYVGSAIDVTEQELLTQELHSREAYLTEAQRLSRTGSFGWKPDRDRKSTRLNSSHVEISYAVFCLKKKTLL